MKFINRFFFIFTITFVLTFPFPFYLMPDVGSFFSEWFRKTNELWGDLLQIDSNSVFQILSDSTGLYLHLITITLISVLGSFIWFFIQKHDNSKLKNYYIIGLSYYLALILFKYGLDKVFKHQFYFPEPNTLFTPLNQLSKDILFWSSMGSSYSYSVFSGLIELLPACLLLFRKTRLLGAIIAMGVLTNVVMINFGFDISVKVYALFLLLISVIIISPNFKRLSQFFSSKKVDSINTVELMFSSNTQLIKYALLKSLVIGIILLESFTPYVKTQNFNNDSFPKPYLFGAYKVDDTFDVSSIKNVFFHRKQYFIIQTNNDKFVSYKLEFSKSKNTLILTNDFDSSVKYTVAYSFNADTNVLLLKGILKGEVLNIKASKIDLNNLQLSKQSFNWTFD